MTLLRQLCLDGICELPLNGMTDYQQNFVGFNQLGMFQKV